MSKTVLLKTISVALSLALAPACTSTRISAPSSFDTHTRAYAKAELEIGEAVSGQASYERLLIFTLNSPTQFADGTSFGVSGGPLDGVFRDYSDLKSAAIYDAIHTLKYDVLLAPRYEITAEDGLIYEKVTVTVKGTGARIKGVRQVDGPWTGRSAQ